MKLLTKCTSCRQQIKVKSIASTRPELASEKGDEFNIICTHCASNIKVHANDVEAFPNSTFLIAGVILSVIATGILWIFLGGVAVATFLIPVLMYQQQSRSTNAFNVYRLRR